MTGALRRLRVGALILAAGESRRMGRTKALLPLEGRTFLEVLVDRFSAAAVGPIIVVLGSAAGERSIFRSSRWRPGFGGTSGER